MQFFKFFLIALSLSGSATSFAQSLPVDDFGFDSPVVENKIPLKIFKFNLVGPSARVRSDLLEKIESTFAQVGCELADVKILSKTPSESKFSALSADCEAPISGNHHASECCAGFEPVRVTFVESSLHLMNDARVGAGNQFCVRVSW